MSKKKDFRTIELTLLFRAEDGPLLGSFYVSCGSLYLKHFNVARSEDGVVRLGKVELKCDTTPIFSIHGHPFIEEIPTSMVKGDYYFKPQAITLNSAKRVVIEVRQKRGELTYTSEHSKSSQEAWKEIFARKYNIGSGTIAKAFADASINFEFEDHKGGSDAMTKKESFTHTFRFPLPILRIAQERNSANDIN
ncbi:hypothetical protein [Maribacter sp. 2-571]|uniref:hypothetical protein n=1 Tax=Maribacter sp. 2-571 TaxID=3417569 RepID=UPI003D331EF9